MLPLLSLSAVSVDLLVPHGRTQPRARFFEDSKHFSYTMMLGESCPLSTFVQTRGSLTESPHAHAKENGLATANERVRDVERISSAHNNLTNNETPQFNIEDKTIPSEKRSPSETNSSSES
eukprot:5813605-Amphidinium_carterae.1